MNSTTAVCSSFSGGKYLSKIPINLGEDNFTTNIDSSSYLSPQAGALSSTILIFVTIVLSQIYFKGFKKSNFGKPQRQIPELTYSPVKLPSFVNSLYFAFRFQRDGLNYFQDLQAKYGNIFQFTAFNKPALGIFDPAVTQKVLSSSSLHHLQKPREIYDKVFVDLLFEGLVASNYELWSEHRKIFSRCFTYSSLKTYLKYMNQHGNALINRLSLACATNDNNSVEGKQVHDATAWELALIIMQTMTGMDVFEDDKHIVLLEVLQRAKDIVQSRLMYPHLIIDFIWNIHPLKKELDGLLTFLRNLLKEAMDKFQAKYVSEKVINGEEDGVKKLQFRSMGEQVLFTGLTNKEILDEAATFAIVGHETTTIAVNLLLFHLACNPECQKFCREEVDQLIGLPENRNEDFHFTMDDLASLKYLERCILEGLRLTPVAPVIARQLGEPLKVDDDFTIETDTILIMSPWCLHRDPKNFPNPEKFDPDRFLPENIKRRHHSVFIPFSSGSRNCIGYKFAIMEMKVVIALILRNFEIFTTTKPEEITYFQKVLLDHDKEIHLILKRRSET